MFLKPCYYILFAICILAGGCQKPNDGKLFTAPLGWSLCEIFDASPSFAMGYVLLPIAQVSSTHGQN